MVPPRRRHGRLPRSFSAVLPFTATRPDSLTVAVAAADFERRTLTPEERRLFGDLACSVVRLTELGTEHVEALFCQNTDLTPRTDEERRMVADFVAMAGHRPARLVDHAVTVWQESVIGRRGGAGLAPGPK